MDTSISIKGKILQFLVAFVLSVGLIFPTGTVVLAEDTVPPATQEETAPTDPEAPAEPEAPADPVVPVEEPVVEASVEPPAEEVPAVVEQTMEPAAVVTDPSPINGDASESADNVQVQELPQEVVAEVVQVLADNDLAIVDESGNSIPLASVEASELIETADPYFSSGGTTYGWTNVKNGSNQPVCASGVNVCNYSDNPINDAIASVLYTGQQLTIENGTYTSNNVTISKTVNLRPRVNLTVNSFILNNGAVINWSEYNNTQYTLTATNVFVNSGANLTDGLELVASGGIITLGAGNFTPEKNQSISKSVEIKGNGTTGANKTTILAATGSSYTNLLVINANGIKINNLVLDGSNNSDGTSLDADVAIDYTRNFDGLEVYNTIIQNFSSLGILIGDSCGYGGCDNNTYNIHNNTIQNIRGGSSNYDGIGIQVINNTGSSSRTITNNIITNTDIGIDFDDSQLNISGNTLNGNFYGIYLDDSSANITNNNIFSNSYGIYVDDLDDNDDINVNLNRFFGNSNYGLLYNNAASDEPKIDAERNWWGCNLGVANSNCDKAYGANSKVDSNPWLMLGLRASAPSIYTGETSTLTPYMYRSDDASQAAIPGLSWFIPPTVQMAAGTTYGSLTGNIFTAGGFSGIQNFFVEMDNIKRSLNTQVTASVQVKGDTDGDKVENGIDNCPGLSNPAQTDTDLDGFGDACDATPNGDTDGDGIDNLADNCPALSNPDQADNDSDGTGNACDATPNGDSDGDGIDNLADNCPALANPDQADNDSDGTGNACDATPNGDTDGDGIDNLADNCPATANPDQADNDSDGTGNACDATPNGDSDSDGIDNAVDNCPVIANSDQKDNDKDGLGNACDSTPNGPSTGTTPIITLPVGGLPFDAGIIPITGGLNTLSCNIANTLSLPNGDKVVFSDILCDFEAALTQEFSDTMLAPLPTGLTFVDGFNLEVQKNATLFKVLPQPVNNTLSFMVPDAFKGKTLKILFWDPTLKNGMGDWIEIPSKSLTDGEVVSAPLAEGDQRLVVSGVELTTLPTTETTVNFTGLFVLAAQE